MSLLPMYKKCKKCGRYYSFNPDVGEICCPNCYRRGGTIKNIFDVLVGKKK